MTTSQWTRKDARLGVLFVLFGALATSYGVAAARNGVPSPLWLGALVLGPLMLLLGGNALVRSLRAPR